MRHGLSLFTISEREIVCWDPVSEIFKYRISFYWEIQNQHFIPEINSRFHTSERRNRSFLEARFCNILFSYPRVSAFSNCRYVYIGITIIEYERKHNRHRYILLGHEGIPKAMTPLIWPVLSNQQNFQLSKNFRVTAALLRRSQNRITVCRAPCTSTAVMISNLNWRVLIQKLYIVYCSLQTHKYLAIIFIFKYRTRAANEWHSWVNESLVSSYKYITVH